MPGQRHWILWAVLAYLGVLLATVVGLGLLYRAARTQLDDALGERLLGVASSAQHLVDGDRVKTWAYDPETGTDLLWLATRLDRIRVDNELAEVTLCDRDGYVLASASGRLDRGDQNVFWDLDRPAVELAREGVPSVSRLYRSFDLVQKSAHVPVTDRDGRVTGVLTVEGDADFLQALASLRGGAVVTLVAVVAFLAVMGAVLLGIHRALERTRRDLARQEQLAAMGRMTAGIAHEIRNPLGIIRGSAQHLQRVLADHGLDDEVASFIPEEVDRLDRILSSYLAFGRDDEGEAEPLALDQLVRRSLRLATDDYQQTDVALELEHCDEATVRGDAPRLQQVVLNLLLNARDAAPTGSAVTVQVVRRDGHAHVHVADRGPGLSADAAAHAFDPFWTTKDKGSGLGLSVSRRLARQHGGDLVLACRQPGPGCEAILSLPLAPTSTESRHG